MAALATQITAAIQIDGRQLVRQHYQQRRSAQPPAASRLAFNKLAQAENEKSV